MSYLAFLAEPYNLPFVLAAVVAAASVPVARRLGGDSLGATAGLIAAAITGLTWNGAIHDLALGSPAPRFPLVLAVSIAVGLLTGRAAVRFRDRHFPPIRDVRLTEPGHEGLEAIVVSRQVASEPGSGRVQWQDDDGVMHVVRCHSSGEVLPFGRTVRLVEFDARDRSYLVTGLRAR
ncbi:MAG: hypothetical protein ACE5JR_01795 [Gemmatimonadota bacterium]